MPTRQAYSTDVKDDEWEFVAPYLMLLRLDAGQREHDLREVFNALRYVVKAGLPWRLLTSADISDAAGAQKVLDALRIRWPWVKHLFADSAYDRTILMDKAATLDFVVEVVHKMQDQHGFIPLPRRWVVERTLGWMMQWRRLVRDYERRIDVAESMIYVAMSDLLLKRLFE